MDPRPSQWVALPLGLVPLLLLISLVMVPPDSEYSKLTLTEDPQTPSGYRIAGAPPGLLQEKQFEEVPFTSWYELVTYYRLQRRTWNDEEWYWFLNTVCEVNKFQVPEDGKTPDFIWIPSLRAECEIAALGK